MPSRAVPGSHPDAPHRPHVDVVDVRDLAVRREARVGPRVHARPADDLVAVVRDDAGRRVLCDEFADPVAAGGALERQILFRRREPVAQAPAHVRVGPLGPHHGRDVDEDGRRSHFDRHVATLPPASDTGNDVKPAAATPGGWMRLLRLDTSELVGKNGKVGTEAAEPRDRSVGPQ